jgi:hypothetical protein
MCTNIYDPLHTKWYTPSSGDLLVIDIKPAAKEIVRMGGIFIVYNLKDSKNESFIFFHRHTQFRDSKLGRTIVARVCQSIMPLSLIVRRYQVEVVSNGKMATQHVVKSGYSFIHQWL